LDVRLAVSGHQFLHHAVQEDDQGRDRDRSRGLQEGLASLLEGVQRLAGARVVIVPKIEAKSQFG
jgi:hypothetical protein